MSLKAAVSNNRLTLNRKLWISNQPHDGLVVFLFVPNFLIQLNECRSLKNFLKVKQSLKAVKVQIDFGFMEIGWSEACEIAWGLNTKIYQLLQY